MAVAIEKPVTIGPTWEKDEQGDWLLPKMTLGWDVLAWTAEFLRQPDGPETGRPWRYTEEQARFLLWWFAIDESGQFLHRYGMLRRVKGWGKDPIAATICGTEFVGPCRFDGFDANGRPVAIPHQTSWVLVAAVAKQQTRNTMTLFPSLFTDTLINDCDIDLGKDLIYAHGGRSRLEAVTSSPRALEGPRPTFTLKNETQHWIKTNEGHAMSEVITRNTTKARDGAARVLAISNAHEPGEDSDAERDLDAYKAMEQGRSKGRGFLYDSVEASPEIDLADEEQLRRGLREARGDSDWLDENRHVEEIYDPRNSPASSRRFYLNQIVAAEDAWLAPHLWDAIADPEIEVEPGTEITLGFDGSKTDDHSVLRGCRVSDGFTFTLGFWDPEQHGGEVPRDLIDAAVEAAHERYTVIAFFSDLHPFESYVDKWAEQYAVKYEIKANPKHPVAWDMRSRNKDFTIELERLYDEIVEKAFRDDGDKRVQQHFHNARRRPNAWGVSVGKEHRESSRKIDAVPATVLARMARRLVTSTDRRRRRRKRSRKASF